MSRSQAAPASQVARAKAVLAVAEGHTYATAARHAGRVSGDAVSQLVARFNRQGLAAVVPGHGGGPPVQYTVRERELILAQARRTPERERDGTATWSLSTLQRALRQQALPAVSRTTIWCVLRAGACCGLVRVAGWCVLRAGACCGLVRVAGWCVLREAGLSWQKSRTWCDTGAVQRRRKSGVVRVLDGDAEAKKS